MVDSHSTTSVTKHCSRMQSDGCSLAVLIKTLLSWKIKWLFLLELVGHKVISKEKLLCC